MKKFKATAQKRRLIKALKSNQNNKKNEKPKQSQKETVKRKVRKDKKTYNNSYVDDL